MPTVTATYHPSWELMFGAIKTTWANQGLNSTIGAITKDQAQQRSDPRTGYAVATIISDATELRTNKHQYDRVEFEIAVFHASAEEAAERIARLLTALDQSEQPLVLEGGNLLSLTPSNVRSDKMWELEHARQGFVARIARPRFNR